MKSLPFCFAALFFIALLNNQGVVSWAHNIMPCSNTIHPFNHSSKANAIIGLPQGYALAKSPENTIHIFDDKNKELRILKGHSGTINNMAFISSGSKLVSCSQDKTVKIWNIKTGALVFNFSGHTDAVKAVTFLNKLNLVASLQVTGEILLWEPSNGNVAKMLKVPTPYPTPISISAIENSTKLAIGALTDGLIFVDLHQLRKPVYAKLPTFEHSYIPFESLCPIPKTSYIAAGSSFSNQVYIFNFKRQNSPPITFTLPNRLTLLKDSLTFIEKLGVLAIRNPGTVGLYKLTLGEHFIELKSSPKLFTMEDHTGPANATSQSTDNIVSGPAAFVESSSKLNIMLHKGIKVYDLKEFANIADGPGECKIVCNSGHFINKEGMCAKCDANCGECSGPGSKQCLSCKTPLRLFYKTCVEFCPEESYLLADGSCECMEGFKFERGKCSMTAGFRAQSEEGRDEVLTGILVFVLICCVVAGTLVCLCQFCDKGKETPQDIFERTEVYDNNKFFSINTQSGKKENLDSTNILTQVGSPRRLHRENSEIFHTAKEISASKFFGISDMKYEESLKSLDTTENSVELQKKSSVGSPDRK